MLLQPDSELYIIPAEGGQARRLQANTGADEFLAQLVAPNGKWIVFSSKALSIYTQLFLTHIDEQGESTPPVVLPHFHRTQPSRQHPEFVNAKPDAIGRISFSFLDDRSYVRTGYQKQIQGDFSGAVDDYRKAIELDPTTTRRRYYLGMCYTSLGQHDQALPCFERVVELDPSRAAAHLNRGMILVRQRKFAEPCDPSAKPCVASR